MIFSIGTGVISRSMLFSREVGLLNDKAQTRRRVSGDVGCSALLGGTLFLT
jgi:hypothetical protein